MLSSHIWITSCAVVASALCIYWAGIFGAPALMLALMRRNIRQRNQLQEHAVQVDDVTWSYLRGGLGSPLILLPGFGSHKYQWGPDLYKLARQFDLIVLDLPGGGSTRVAASAALTPDAQAERVIRLLDSIRITRPCILMGASIGGLIAGLVASRRRELVSRLILIDPAGLAGEEVSDVLKRFLDSGDHPFSYESRVQLDRLYELLFKKQPKLPAFLKEYLVRLNQGSISLRERYVHAVRPFVLNGLDGTLDSLATKVLLIWGREDKIFHSSAANRVAATSPHINVHLLDTGHLPYLEAPNNTYQIIHSFLMGGT